MHPPSRTGDESELGEAHSGPATRHSTTLASGSSVELRRGGHAPPWLAGLDEDAVDADVETGNVGRAGSASGGSVVGRGNAYSFGSASDAAASSATTRSGTASSSSSSTSGSVHLEEDEPGHTGGKSSSTDALVDEADVSDEVDSHDADESRRSTKGGTSSETLPRGEVVMPSAAL